MGRTPVVTLHRANFGPSFRTFILNKKGSSSFRSMICLPLATVRLQWGLVEAEDSGPLLRRIDLHSGCTWGARAIARPTKSPSWQLIDLCRGRFRSYLANEKVSNSTCNFAVMCLQREVARVIKTHFRFADIAFECLCAGRQKEGIVFAPHC